MKATKRFNLINSLVKMNHLQSSYKITLKNNNHTLSSLKRKVKRKDERKTTKKNLFQEQRKQKEKEIRQILDDQRGTEK